MSGSENYDNSNDDSDRDQSYGEEVKIDTKLEELSDTGEVDQEDED